jgi:hypothetical protein
MTVVSAGFSFNFVESWSHFQVCLPFPLQKKGDGEGDPIP